MYICVHIERTAGSIADTGTYQNRIMRSVYIYRSCTYKHAFIHTHTHPLSFSPSLSLPHPHTAYHSIWGVYARH